MYESVYVGSGGGRRRRWCVGWRVGELRMEAGEGAQSVEHVCVCTQRYRLLSLYVIVFCAPPRSTQHTKQTTPHSATHPYLHPLPSVCILCVVLEQAQVERGAVDGSSSLTFGGGGGGRQTHTNTERDAKHTQQSTAQHNKSISTTTTRARLQSASAASPLSPSQLTTPSQSRPPLSESNPS